MIRGRQQDVAMNLRRRFAVAITKLNENSSRKVGATARLAGPSIPSCRAKSFLQLTRETTFSQPLLAGRIRDPNVPVDRKLTKPYPRMDARYGRAHNSPDFFLLLPGRITGHSHEHEFVSVAYLKETRGLPAQRKRSSAQPGWSKLTTITIAMLLSSLGLDSIHYSLVIFAHIFSHSTHPTHISLQLFTSMQILLYKFDEKHTLNHAHTSYHVPERINFLPSCSLIFF